MGARLDEHAADPSHAPHQRGRVKRRLRAPGGDRNQRSDHRSNRWSKKPVVKTPLVKKPVVKKTGAQKTNHRPPVRRPARRRGRAASRTGAAGRRARRTPASRARTPAPPARTRRLARDRGSGAGRHAHCAVREQQRRLERADHGAAAPIDPRRRFAAPSRRRCSDPHSAVFHRTARRRRRWHGSEFVVENGRIRGRIHRGGHLEHVHALGRSEAAAELLRPPAPRRRGRTAAGGVWEAESRVRDVVG